MLVKIDWAFHALTCFSPFYGIFSRSCVIGAMRLFSVSVTALTIWYWGTAQLSCWLSGSLVKLFFGTTWADFECRYAYLSADRQVVTFKFLPRLTLWKTPSTYLPTFLRFRAWFSEKFTVCSWRFSLLHSFNTVFLLMMTAISEGRFSQKWDWLFRDGVV